MQPYSLETNPLDEAAVRIADLEHRLMTWLAKSPDVLTALLAACRGDSRLEHVAKTLARMASLQREFDVEQNAMTVNT